MCCAADHPRTQVLRNSTCYNPSQFWGCWLSWAVVRCVSDGVGPDGGWSWSHWKARLGRASKWLLHIHVCPLHVPPCDVCLSLFNRRAWAASVVLRVPGGRVWHSMTSVTFSAEMEGGGSPRAVPQESMWDGQCYHHHPWRCNLPQSGSSPWKSGPEPVC